MPHTLTLMRHGAYDENTTLLTPEGEQQAISTATRLVKHNLVPELLVHSPLPRAVQTAKLVCETFEKLGKPVPSLMAEWLGEKQAHSTNQLEQIAALPQGTHNIMLVTHNPNIAVMRMGFNKQDMDALKGTEHATALTFTKEASSWAAFTAAPAFKSRIKPNVSHGHTAPRP